MLWACLHFPLLCLETLARSTETALPLAVTDGATRPRILACDPHAQQAGVRTRMDVSAALALAPQLVVHPRNRALERQSLREIAQWALQFGPAPSLEGEDAVLLEIGASLKLFGGARKLAQEIAGALPALGFTAWLAAAPTPAAALMLARAQRAQIVTEAASLAPTLAKLPVAVLDLPAATLETLHDLGMPVLGDLLALPRDALARRFGTRLLDLLDRALGRKPDPRLPLALPEQFSSRLELPAPAWEVAALLFAAKRLVAALCGWLRGRGLGAMRLRLELVHEDREPSAVRLNLSAPSRDEIHLAALLRERLDRVQLPDRVEAIVLVTEHCEALAARDLGLFPGMDAREDHELIERLCARLGDEAVLALRPHADHRPELAWRMQAPAQPATPMLPPGPRPLWLLREPKILEDYLGRSQTPIVLSDGPEKIESGWWEARDVRRDYYVARTQAGERLWVYREARPVCPEEAHPPALVWYVHGIFA
ncbi:MAG: DNA polymerase Y family protein [Burkholderiales bacterium]|nr:DNA polymerase Y family protein [Burkholderiales bacterium]